MTDSLTIARSRVPPLACKGLCHDTCGPVAWSKAEAADWSNQGIATPTTDAALTCSHLTPGKRCAIYAHRPMICRLWGTLERMRCPHGCVPVGGMLTESQAWAIWDADSSPLVGCSFPLPGAMP